MCLVQNVYKFISNQNISSLEKNRSKHRWLESGAASRSGCPECLAGCGATASHGFCIASSQGEAVLVFFFSEGFRW